MDRKREKRRNYCEKYNKKRAFSGLTLILTASCGGMSVPAQRTVDIQGMRKQQKEDCGDEVREATKIFRKIMSVADTKTKN